MRIFFVIMGFVFFGCISKVYEMKKSFCILYENRLNFV